MAGRCTGVRGRTTIRAIKAILAGGSTMKRWAMTMMALVALIGLMGTAVACSEADDEAGVPSGATTPGSDSSASNGTNPCEGLELLECARLSTIGSLVPDAPVAAEGEPLVIGMVNEEDTPVNSFPELSASVRAAIEFVNEQLGGIGGRPVQLEVCSTNFSTEGSAACGQRFVERQVPVVLGGIDVFGTAVEVLADNGIAYVGGIPISTQSVTSNNSFQWSGGTWGAAVAFAGEAADTLGAERVSVVYGEFGSITDSANYARTVLEARGVTAQLVPVPIMATDFTSPLTAVAATDPDAVIVLAADAGCKAAFDAVRTVGIEAPVFYVGACAAPNVVASVPPEATDGAFFNVEGPVDIDNPDPDFTFYFRVLETYAPDVDAVGAATVSFRSFMNLWSILVGLAAADDGVDGITADEVTAALQAQVDTPSFMGHPYTCDGEQIAGLRAMCSPQQILVRMQDREVTQVTDWIDVGRLYDESL